MIKSQEKRKEPYPTVLVSVTVFLFWGFVTASNGIYTLFCKDHFRLPGRVIIFPAQEDLADISFIGIHFSYIVPVIAYTFLALFAYPVKGLLKS